MKVHTTNYINTFIAVAADCRSTTGEKPPVRGDKESIANIQFELLYKHPYQYTSDDVLFKVYAMRNDLTKTEMKEARAIFFSKGQACFRASPLTKRYGWGVHADANGKIAIYGCETKAYKDFLTDSSLHIVRAMKSNRQ